MAREHIAIFDPNAFYPFRRLVEGPLRPHDLEPIERFIRAIVLHDRMDMVIDPLAFDPESYFETRRQHPHQENIIIGFGPDLSHYKDLLSSRSMADLSRNDAPNLSRELLALASRFSNAEEGNPYYEAHLQLLQCVLAVEKGYGSVICDGEFVRAVELTAKEYPASLFNSLDKHWQSYARDVENGHLGPLIPPILSIVLTRCRGREYIPAVLEDLRSEWANARKKLWDLIGRLKMAGTLEEANGIRQQLAEASDHFCPNHKGGGISPMRVIWKLMEEIPAAMITATASGGQPSVGALVGGVKGLVSGITPSGRNFATTLFGRGALDLARRVRHAVLKVEPMPKLLSRFLTETEKADFGL